MGTRCSLICPRQLGMHCLDCLHTGVQHWHRQHTLQPVYLAACSRYVQTDSCLHVPLLQTHMYKQTRSRFASDDKQTHHAIYIYIYRWYGSKTNTKAALKLTSDLIIDAFKQTPSGERLRTIKSYYLCHTINFLYNNNNKSWTQCKSSQRDYSYAEIPPEVSARVHRPAMVSEFPVHQK